MARRKRRRFGFTAAVHKARGKDAGREAMRFLRLARTAPTCARAIDSLALGNFWLGRFRAEKAAARGKRDSGHGSIGRIAGDAKKRVFAKCRVSY
jgi:hypothetical protein